MAFVMKTHRFDDIGENGGTFYQYRIRISGAALTTYGLVEPRYGELTFQRYTRINAV
jgi:hypothetical protein